MTVYGWNQETGVEVVSKNIESKFIEKHCITSSEIYLKDGSGIPDGRWFTTFCAAKKAAIEELTFDVHVLQAKIRNVRKQRRKVLQ